MVKITHYVKKVGDEITLCGFPHVNTGVYVCADKSKVNCPKCKRKLEEAQRR